MPTLNSATNSFTRNPDTRRDICHAIFRRAARQGGYGIIAGDFHPDRIGADHLDERSGPCLCICFALRLCPPSPWSESNSPAPPNTPFRRFPPHTVTQAPAADVLALLSPATRATRPVPSVGCSRCIAFAPDMAPRRHYHPNGESQTIFMAVESRACRARRSIDRPASIVYGQDGRGQHHHGEERRHKVAEISLASYVTRPLLGRVLRRLSHACISRFTRAARAPFRHRLSTGPTNARNIGRIAVLPSSFVLGIVKRLDPRPPISRSGTHNFRLSTLRDAIESLMEYPFAGALPLDLQARHTPRSTRAGDHQAPL